MSTHLLEKQWLRQLLREHKSARILDELVAHPERHHRLGRAKSSEVVDALHVPNAVECIARSFAGCRSMSSLLRGTTRQFL